ncbi:hypothetical protein PTSG_03230 [Salpingoeca rosetta]|uniref:HPt domain-containing protein n=1 Tax=Salpingoeca rosetta (strain ATCC 50818 / BSB-021) TaxID=946362 RepID=F2U4L2_SALR5|nr:uncharacterized protein PTSG_03230 [Salpingoeca rosetta]EGD82578.1 hypothetical protein PTSG_03230 [Salpingoeca rosetta]|eukprot:XP_004995814.1 hypothetical protein PTSG_03230 [Salpingoeca rosetta]
MDPSEVLSRNLDSVPLIDEAIFAQVRDIPDLFNDIVASVQEKITKLQGLRHQEVFTAETMKDFGDTAHSLKSGMSVVGCSRLSALCNKIELLGRPGPNQDGMALINTYDTFMQPIIQETMTALQCRFYPQ